MSQKRYTMYEVRWQLVRGRTYSVFFGFVLSTLLIGGTWLTRPAIQKGTYIPYVVATYHRLIPSFQEVRHPTCAEVQCAVFRNGNEDGRWTRQLLRCGFSYTGPAVHPHGVWFWPVLALALLLGPPFIGYIVGAVIDYRTRQKWDGPGERERGSRLCSIDEYNAATKGDGITYWVEERKF